MKRLVVACLLAFAPLAWADYYFAGRIDTYDPVTGLYYKAITDEKHGGFLSSKTGTGPTNIAVVNPETGTVTNLFKAPVEAVEKPQIQAP